MAVSQSDDQRLDREFLDACSKGEYESAMHLLAEEPGAAKRLGAMDERLESAVHKACASGNMQLVKKLVSQKAAIDTEDKTGYRPIVIAVQFGRLDLVEVLSGSGASLTAVNSKDGRHLLHYAAWAGHTELLRHLISTNQFDSELIEMPDSTGRTPLALAAFRCGEDGVHALADAGANPRVTDNWANKPSDLAGRVGKTSSREYLLQCEAGMSAVAATIKLKRGLKKGEAEATGSV